MSENASIRELVEQVVSDSLETHIRALHDSVVDRVLEAVGPVFESILAESNARGQVCGRLKEAVEAVESGAQQADILNALLDGATGFCGRTALLVLRGNSAVGWQARGFADCAAVKSVVVDLTSGAARESVQQRATITATSRTFDRRFIEILGAPAVDEALLLPLIIRDKVAALVYADGGAEKVIEVQPAALELLIRAAGQWVELQALRKTATTATASGQTSQPVSPQASQPAARAAAAVAAVGEMVGRGRPDGHTNQPVTHHGMVAEQHNEAPTGHSYTAVSAHGNTVPSMPQRRQETSASSAASQYPSAVAAPVAAAGENEAQKKARRFAKLLVDEIILYNRAKVVEGRLNGDLYARLKDDIDKSRESYNRRYGQSIAGAADFFNQAIVAGLAENNPALMGSGFGS